MKTETERPNCCTSREVVRSFGESGAGSEVGGNYGRGGRGGGRRRGGSRASETARVSLWTAKPGWRIFRADFMSICFLSCLMNSSSELLNRWIGPASAGQSTLQVKQTLANSSTSHKV